MRQSPCVNISTQPDKKRKTFALWMEFAVALVQRSAQVLAEGSGVTGEEDKQRKVSVSSWRSAELHPRLHVCVGSAGVENAITGLPCLPSLSVIFYRKRIQFTLRPCRKGNKSHKLLLKSFGYLVRPNGLGFVLQISVNTEGLSSCFPVISALCHLVCSCHIITYGENSHWQLKKRSLLIWFFFLFSKVSFLLCH